MQSQEVNSSGIIFIQLNAKIIVVDPLNNVSQRFWREHAPVYFIISLKLNLRI